MKTNRILIGVLFIIILALIGYILIDQSNENELDIGTQEFEIIDNDLAEQPEKADVVNQTQETVGNVVSNARLKTFEDGRIKFTYPKELALNMRTVNSYTLETQRLIDEGNRAMECASVPTNEELQIFFEIEHLDENFTNSYLRKADFTNAKLIGNHNYVVKEDVGGMCNDTDSYIAKLGRNIFGVITINSNTNYDTDLIVESVKFK